MRIFHALNLTASKVSTSRDVITVPNNFDLIRLIAALSVMLVHMKSAGHLPTAGMHDNGFFSFLHTWARIFPGVPIFFIVSGFLITNSWLNNPDLKRYSRARFLRIYPAYFACLVLTIGLLLLTGFWQRLPGLDALYWTVAQLSMFGSIFTPPELFPFANEMVNGSLWTISVEASFYVLVPLIMSRSGWWAVGAVLFSMAVFILDTSRIGRWSLFPTFWYFGLGSLARVHWHIFRPYIEGKALRWILLQVALFMGLAHSHFLPPALLVILMGTTLVGVVLSVAFTSRTLASRLLGGKDISYGIYLYHQPIFHAAFCLGFIGALSSFLAPLVVILVAFISWHVIESPALHLKSIAFQARARVKAAR